MDATAAATQYNPSLIEGELLPEEKRQITAAILESRRLLDIIEQRRTKLLAVIDSRGIHKFIATMQEPTPREYAEYAQAVVLGFSTLPEKLQDTIAKEKDNLLAEYTVYPVPCKVMSYTVVDGPNDFNLAPSTESAGVRFLPDIACLEIKDDGSEVVTISGEHTPPGVPSQGYSQGVDGARCRYLATMRGEAAGANSPH